MSTPTTAQLIGAGLAGIGIALVGGAEDAASTRASSAASTTSADRGVGMAIPMSTILIAALAIAVVLILRK